MTDTDRIDAMERLLRWAEKEMPEEKIGLELRMERGKFVVTVLGPDDCYYGDTLRAAIDGRGAEAVAMTPNADVD